jgi:hypothetical protein
MHIFTKSKIKKKKKERLVYFLYFLLIRKNSNIVPIIGISSVENSGIASPIVESQADPVHVVLLPEEQDSANVIPFPSASGSDGAVVLKVTDALAEPATVVAVE